VRLTDGQLVWSSRCAVVAGVHRSLDRAVEQATRCSVDGADLVGAS
jgi:hypothetical protein